uniref:Uncharacterized protein n=1 Tax=Anguilla anguilla TaxID=7936 RepID=A0A0E9TI92_ANGAN
MTSPLQTEWPGLRVAPLLPEGAGDTNCSSSIYSTGHPHVLSAVYIVVLSIVL